MATSSSILYRRIRAGLGVVCLLGLTKVMFVSNISDTATPCLSPTPERKHRNRDTIRHYVTLFRAISFENMLLLGRAIHGPMPVHGQTLEALSGPLVHTNFARKSSGPMIGPYEFPYRN